MTGGPGSPCLQHRGCSTPSGLMLHRVDLSRGLHPGLFCSTPSGLMLHRVRLSRGFHPGLFVPPLRGGFPVTPSRGLHAGLFCSTPPGWFSGHSHPGFSPRAFLFHPSGVAFRSLPPGVCTPGFSVPPLRGGFRSLPPGVCTPGFSVPPLRGGFPVTPTRGFAPWAFLFHPSPGWLPDRSHGGVAVTMQVNRDRCWRP